MSFQPTQAQLSNHVLNTGDLITSLQRREKTATGSMQGQMEPVLEVLFTITYLGETVVGGILLEVRVI